MQIIVQTGRLGLESPKIRNAAVIVVTFGVFSRTGLSHGNVDEGHGTRVEAYLPRAEGDDARRSVSQETLFAPERWDPHATNRIGTRGAFCDQEPAAAAVGEAVARARELLVSGAQADRAAPVRRVVAAA